ncbi:hypothetical protein C9I94_13275 [Photobacterium swingsii]|uniref:TIGR04255 family protein n=1 Tax=Photobacterium swingsii TaxID=680026 RepID=A0A2T3P541_9GAMM|nr:hypothetical protein [Photobacterium swingsii]PSW23675.1 hypothetical protein C9I94_13275 [Photobacterium swingsii]
MELLHQTHQLHFFSNNGDIEPTAPFINAFKQELQAFNLVPVSGNELNLNGSTGQHRQFLILMTPDNKLRVEFPSSEIVVVVEGGTIEEFREISSTVLSAIEKLFPMKVANRLSILNSKYFRSDVESYSNLYHALFTHKDAEPFEWDNRIVERKELPETKELINSISTIRRSEIRSPFIDGGRQQDIVAMEIDSNTLHQNTEMRFSIQQAKKIFAELYSNNDTLTDALGRYF